MCVDFCWINGENWIFVLKIGGFDNIVGDYVLGIGDINGFNGKFGFGELNLGMGDNRLVYVIKLVE